MTHIRRGAVATNKQTPYISAAGREQQTRKARNNLGWALALDAGGVKALIYGGIAEAINHNPHLATSIERGVKNPLAWTAFGSVLMGGEYVKNIITKRNHHQSLDLTSESHLILSPAFVAE